MRFKTLSAVLLFFNGMAFSADIPVLEPEPDAFFEALRPTARISAARVVTGVMLDAEDTEEKPSAYAVVHPDWRGESVCMRWLSSDALYEAWAEYVLPEAEGGGAPLGWRGGLIRLNFGSKHEKLLKDLSANKLGIAVTKGKCDAPSSIYAPVIWNGAAVSTGQDVVLLVHARGADEVYLVHDGPPPDESEGPYIDCSPLRHGDTVGIDHECPIPAGVLASGRVEIELNRLRRGLPDDPISFSIEMAIQE